MALRTWMHTAWALTDRYDFHIAAGFHGNNFMRRLNTLFVSSDMISELDNIGNRDTKTCVESS